MKRSLVAFVIVFLLMVNIASAGFLDYYGKIIGTAVVEGPTFYASNENITGTFYKKLLINQPPTEEQKGEVSFIDGQSQSFGSNSLNVNSFYRPKFDLNVTAKVNNATIPRPILFSVYVWDPLTANIIRPAICEAMISITSTSYVLYTATCSGNSSLSLGPSYGFLWEIKGGTGLTDITYTINLDTTTKFEVSPA
jgi:hypothetical protein